MPHVFGPVETQPFRLSWGGDGRSHPIENLLSVATLVCGLVAIVAGFITDAHVIASWAGMLGFVGGLWSQYVSATTAERSLNVIGIVASFVGATLGIYHGGFMP
ncbi:hypothetical protein [Streptosporangium sp. KLBMP 9127]|nr:hypothetical protein [Streptosporangium sp. KLBMP 9127]